MSPVKVLGPLLMLAAAAGAARSSAPEGLWLRVALDAVGACSRSRAGWAECLAERGAWWAERALRLRSLPIADGVSLVRSGAATPRSADPLSAMMQTFSLQIDPPAVLTDPQRLAKVVDEGRGKLKKYWKPLMLIVTAIKAYLFFTAVATLALFIGKALLVSKVALALALSALYKKYFGKKETIEVIKVQHHSQSSEGHHHHEGYSSSSEWESGSSGGYSSYGGGGGGGEEYGSSGGGGGYDKRRADQAPAAAATTTGADLAYRGQRRDGSAAPGVRWSPREEQWQSGEGEKEGAGAGAEGSGREERSECWGDGFRRRKCRGQ